MLNNLINFFLILLQFLIFAALAVGALAAEKPYYPKPAYPPAAYPSYEKSYEYVSKKNFQFVLEFLIFRNL